MKYYTEGYVDGVVSTAVETKILFLPASPFLFEEKSDSKEEPRKYCLLKAEMANGDSDFTSAILKYCPYGYFEAKFLRLSISDALALKCGRQKIRIAGEKPTNLVFEEWKTV